MRGFSKGVAVLAAAGLVGVLGAVPASAATNPRSAAGAGFTSTPTEGDGSVSATFTVPKVTCASPTETEWLRLGVFFFQAGHPFSDQSADILVQCTNGKATYLTSVCADADASERCAIDVAHPAHVIVASIVETPTTVLSSVRDMTNGHVDQSFQPFAASGDVSAFIGAGGTASFGVDAIPTFTTVPFTQVQVNGQYLSAYSPTATNYGNGGDVQVATGALKAKTDTFTLTFKHNN